MLQINNLQFNYDAQKSFCFNLSAKSGEIKLIRGASGSGKTTLLNLIAGLLQPSKGEILLAGKNLVALAPWQRPLAILFQDQNLFAHLSAKENIALGINTNLRKGLKEEKKILQALHKVGLEPSYLNQLPAQLSGGQKQRVALARALVAEKKILLLDEPFTGLDQDLRKAFSEILTQLVEQEQLICLLVSHDQEELNYFSEVYKVE